MTITLHSSGTQTATVGTEHFLSNPNVADEYMTVIDLSAMVAGDFLEVRAYQMVLTGGTSRPFWLETYQGIQPADLQEARTPWVPNDLTDTNAVRFSMNQKLGTSRNFPWKTLRRSNGANIRKNQALAKFSFLMTDSTAHAPATGKTVTVTRSIDGGAFGAGTLANITEVANGIYTVDFLAADLNGNVIVMRATASGCDDTFATLVTSL